MAVIKSSIFNEGYQNALGIGGVSASGGVQDSSITWLNYNGIFDVSEEVDVAGNNIADVRSCKIDQSHALTVFIDANDSNKLKGIISTIGGTAPNRTITNSSVFEIVGVACDHADCVYMSDGLVVVSYELVSDSTLYSRTLEFTNGVLDVVNSAVAMSATYTTVQRITTQALDTTTFVCVFVTSATIRAAAGSLSGSTITAEDEHTTGVTYSTFLNAAVITSGRLLVTTRNAGGNKSRHLYIDYSASTLSNSSTADLVDMSGASVPFSASSISSTEAIGLYAESNTGDVLVRGLDLSGATPARQSGASSDDIKTVLGINGTYAPFTFDDDTQITPNFISFDSSYFIGAGFVNGAVTLFIINVTDFTNEKFDVRAWNVQGNMYELNAASTITASNLTLVKLNDLDALVTFYNRDTDNVHTKLITIRDLDINYPTWRLSGAQTFGYNNCSAPLVVGNPEDTTAETSMGSNNDVFVPPNMIKQIDEKKYFVGVCSTGASPGAQAAFLRDFNGIPSISQLKQFVSGTVWQTSTHLVVSANKENIVFGQWNSGAFEVYNIDVVNNDSNDIDYNSQPDLEGSAYTISGVKTSSFVLAGYTTTNATYDGNVIAFYVQSASDDIIKADYLETDTGSTPTIEGSTQSVLTAADPGDALTLYDVVEMADGEYLIAYTDDATGKDLPRLAYYSSDIPSTFTFTQEIAGTTIDSGLTYNVRDMRIVKISDTKAYVLYREDTNNDGNTTPGDPVYGKLITIGASSFTVESTADENVIYNTCDLNPAELGVVSLESNIFMLTYYDGTVGAMTRVIEYDATSDDVLLYTQQIGGGGYSPIGSSVYWSAHVSTENSRFMWVTQGEVAGLAYGARLSILEQFTC